jgi:hypothetical protein
MCSSPSVKIIFEFPDARVGCVEKRMLAWKLVCKRGWRRKEGEPLTANGRAT